MLEFKIILNLLKAYKNFISDSLFSIAFHTLIKSLFINKTSNREIILIRNSLINEKCKRFVVVHIIVEKAFFKIVGVMSSLIKCVFNAVASLTVNELSIC